MSGSPSPIRLTTPTSLLNSSSSPALNILSSSSDLINEHNDSNPTDSETNHKLKPQSIPKSSSMFSILNNHRFSMALNPSDFKQQQQQQYQQLQQPQQLQPEELGILDRMSRLQKTLREQNLFHQQLRTDIQNACDRINGWRMNLPLIINHTRLQFVAVDKNYSSQTMMEGPWLGSDPSFMNILLTTSAAGSHLSASTDDILTLVPTSASATSIAKATGKKLFQGFWSSNSSASVSIGNSLNSTTSNLNDNSTNSNGSYQQSSSLLKLASVTKPSRMFKYHDKDHPFSVLKRHYEEFIEFIRQQPKLFCRSIKNWISKQFINQLILQRKSMKNVKVSSPTETLSPSGSSSTTEDFESCDRLAFIMIYSLYGNAGNPLETKCILKFIKTTFDIVFESCSSENPFEVFENIFLYRLVFLYLRRKGKHFIKSIMTEPLFDLLSNDDLEVPLDISPVSSQPTSQEKSESNKPSKPPILFFQNTCSVNTNDVSPVSPDCVTSSVFNTQQQMKQQLITQSMIDANLYNICTRILHCLYEKISTLPPPILLLFKYLLKAFSKRNGALVTQNQKIQMLKRLLFGWFLLPAISRPECFELTDVPVGSKLQNKLKSVIQVLHYTSMEKTFDRTSPFFYLNDFIKGHTLKINSMFENMLNDWFYERNDLVGNLKIYINNHVRKSVVTSSSIEELKKYQILSPICISTKDVELIFHLCMESTFFQTCEDVPKAILENLQEIQSWNRKNYRDEKFIIMNHKSLNLDEIMKNIDALVSSNNESKNNATQRTSQLLKHVLLSVDSIERICSELKYLGEDDMHTFLQLLKLMDSQERNDGSIERCVISCYIQELVQELKTSSENQTMDDLINNVMKDAELWDENIQLMITKHKKLLRILHSVELQVNELEKERKTADDIFDNISVGELINEIDFKQFVKDFLKSAFLEDQKKLIKNQFSAKRAEIFNMLKEVKVPEHQLERIEKFLQKTIMSKIYRQMVPRIFDNTNPSQRQLFNKEDNLLGTKISLLFDVEPLDFGISQKYSKVCDSKMAQLELRKLDTFIMPEEKVKVIVHCCSILIETMKISGNSYNIDDLLILLVYNIVRSNTPYLYSHLIYCKRFCGVFLEASKQPQVLSGIPPEHEYWFNQFETAVQFLLDFNVEEALMTPTTTTTTTTTTNTANSSQQTLHSKKRMSSKPSISSVHSREGNTSMMSQFSDQQPHTNTNSIDSFTASSTCELFEGNSNEEVDMIHFYKNNKITQVDETIMEADEVNTSPMIFMKSHNSFISGGNILNNKSNRELAQVGTFEHTKVDDLKHSEISKLLSEYKQLLTFYKDHAQTSQEQV